MRNSPRQRRPKADEGKTRTVYTTRVERNSGENSDNDNETQVLKSGGDKNGGKTETGSEAQKTRGQNDRSW